MDELEKTDLLWALQYACDIARQAGDIDLADEMARSGDASEAELRSTFAMAQLMALGLQVRKLQLGLSPLLTN